MLTSKQLIKMRELYDSGLGDTAIAAELGVSRYAVMRWRRARNLATKSGHTGRKPKDYIFYDGKTDELIVCGDARTCAAYLGMSVSGLRSCISRCRTGKTSKYVVYQSDIDDDDACDAASNF